MNFANLIFEKPLLTPKSYKVKSSGKSHCSDVIAGCKTCVCYKCCTKWGAKLYNIYKIEYFIIKNFVKSQYIPI